MSQVSIVSTTDSKEAVDAALGNLAQTEEVKKETKSASVEETEETQEESETSEETESKEDLEAKADEESEEEESKEEDEKPLKKNSNGFKRRIDKLNRRLSDKDREVEFWKSQVIKPAAQQPQTTTPEPKVQTGKPVRPNIEDFETHAEYNKAIDKYAEDLWDWKDGERQKQAKENQLKAEFQDRNKAWVESETKCREAHDDWEEVMENVAGIVVSMGLREALFDSEDGAEVAYLLAKDEKEFQRINSLPPLKAAVELGKFIKSHAKSSQSTTTETKQTKAPKPITPVSKSSATSTKSPDEMDYQEFKKWREAN